MLFTWENDYMRVARFALWPALMACLLAGCATGPKIDWSSRVGNYTYDQSVRELGTPDKSAKQDDGTTVAEWLMRSYAPATMESSGGGYAGEPNNMSPGSATSGQLDFARVPDTVAIYPQGQDAGQWLRLMFAPDGQLQSWKRFHR
jgi:hypothetical protein